jgi:nicotinamide mononucleotide transporter
VAAYALAVAASAALLIAAYTHRTPFSSQEAWGFVTGGWCVWLQVKENIWAWPISLVNNAVFFFLFQRERLFGDMGLQAAYFTWAPTAGTRGYSADKRTRTRRWSDPRRGCW